jgi:hypothetical protein
MAKQYRTCSVCRQTGHNSRTCPSLGRDKKENRPKYEVYDWDKEEYVLKQRTCSLCGKPGHTKRTCPREISDMYGDAVNIGDLIFARGRLCMLTRIWVDKPEWTWRKKDNVERLWMEAVVLQRRSDYDQQDCGDTIKLRYRAARFELVQDMAKAAQLLRL